MADNNTNVKESNIDSELSETKSVTVEVSTDNESSTDNVKQNNNSILVSDKSDNDDMEDFLEFYNNIYKALKNRELNESNFVLTLVTVMQHAQSLSNMEGPAKRDLAIRVVIKLIKNLKIDEDSKVMINHLANKAVLASIIDVVISISKGKFINKNVKKCLNKTFGSCLGSQK